MTPRMQKLIKLSMRAEKARIMALELDLPVMAHLLSMAQLEMLTAVRMEYLNETDVPQRRHADPLN